MSDETTAGIYFEPNLLKPGSLTLSLPAGHTCPFAESCLSRVDRENGVMHAGGRFVCQSAVDEIDWKTRDRRWQNYETLKAAGDDKDELAYLITEFLPAHTRTLFLHNSGDFFSENYFLAWLQVGKEFPQMEILVETTSILYWVRNLSQIPDNIKISAHLGTLHRNTVKEYKLPYHAVLFSAQDAEEYGLPVDDSYEHLRNRENYATLVKSLQIKGTPAGDSVESFGTGYALSREQLMGDWSIT
jgi:hypothetical protein